MNTECNVDQIALAALLHDIGKFSYRAGVRPDSQYNVLSKEDFGRNGAHAKWSADFVRAYVNDPVVEDLVLHHHLPERARYHASSRIIRDADHLSSAVDRKPREGKGDPRHDPLISVFPSVQLSGMHDHSESLYQWNHLLRPLTLEREDTFPTRESHATSYKEGNPYRNLWDHFVREFETAGHPPTFGTALALLRKYTSLIPSATYVNVPDISLYDHAKTTAALAVCLHFREKASPFLLVQGRLSGIQSFIFGVATPQDARKGMAKRLRGRSFWLNLLADATAREMVEAADATEANILWNTGGNFLLLLPNTSRVHDAVGQITRKINTTLLQKNGGSLSLVVGSLPCSREEMKDFPSLLDHLNAIVGRKKFQKFIDCDPLFRAHGRVYEIADLCPVCGLPLTPNGTCAECRTHEALGAAIARARYLLRGTGLRFAFDEFGLSTTYDLTEGPDCSPGEAVITINSTEFLIDGVEETGFMYLGNTVPLSGTRILTLSDLAYLATGDRKIGVFKADVDRLGRIMAAGLPKDDRSISRIYTLSTRFQYFFAGYLTTLCQEFGVYRRLCPECREHAQKIEVPDSDRPGDPAVFYTWIDSEAEPCPECKKHFVPSLYVIYSGGDDLLVLGPWDHILRFAQRFHDEFTCYVCANPAITLSAGIAVVPPQLPVSIAVEEAERSLQRAKKDGRNRVVIFGESLRWEDNGYEKGFSTLMDSGLALETYVDEQIVSRSFVHTLNDLWEDTFADLGERPLDKQCLERIRRKRYLPYLKYQVAGNVRTNGKPRTRDEVERAIVPIFGWARLPLLWTILRTRGV
ncbi:type III-A CRISPR-associated protein Cas10/Csm1 [Methanofollis formosanus]|uniref:CRISPR system single-strand-specific deoxyribonuclease Cas10/Csm1 (subtype III-A) n=1 Tax=Methanofollis formosanus TaxID=299308 RepID=A0A8G1A0K3_9EURY|nr:type III-A CRISPR-associated protein Cas10/Csm1 [Methanofollis formosanus]QYZ78206.1 type III-A CRISPR-associated protein Cas10/Csm1 [Methanofollis formosanus]